MQSAHGISGTLELLSTRTFFASDIGEQLAARKAQLESQPDLLKTVKKLKDAGKGLVTRVLTEV